MGFITYSVFSVSLQIVNCIEMFAFHGLNLLLVVLFGSLQYFIFLIF
jgi:hypothetical protein